MGKQLKHPLCYKEEETHSLCEVESYPARAYFSVGWASPFTVGPVALTTSPAVVGYPRAADEFGDTPALNIEGWAGLGVVSGTADDSSKFGSTSFLVNSRPLQSPSLLISHFSSLGQEFSKVPVEKCPELGPFP